MCALWILQRPLGLFSCASHGTGDAFSSECVFIFYPLPHWWLVLNKCSIILPKNSWKEWKPHNANLFPLSPPLSLQEISLAPTDRELSNLILASSSSHSAIKAASHPSLLLDFLLQWDNKSSVWLLWRPLTWLKENVEAPLPLLLNGRGKGRVMMEAQLFQRNVLPNPA